MNGEDFRSCGRKRKERKRKKEKGKGKKVNRRKGRNKFEWLNPSS